MTNENKLQKKFPFLTGIQYNTIEYVGIVQNTDNQIISFYDIDSCRNDVEKKLMLEYGDLWWWESNRQLPIDVFLNIEMKMFQPCLKTFIMKDVEILFGPTTSLQNLLKKRIKRRGIQLVKKTD